MMKRFLLYIISIFVVSQAFAQYESAGMPMKFTQEKQGMKRSASSFFIDINADTTKVSIDDSNRRFVSGVTCPVDISMNDGNSFVEGDLKVWRVGVRSENAKGISLYFDNFLLPEGGKLFVYNPEQTVVYGAFTSENNNKENKLLIRPLASDSVVVEYQEPLGASFDAQLHISLATHELRGANKFNYSNECSPHATHEEKTEKLRQSVCMLFMVDDVESYWGSGALINNTEHKPYIYTAGHNLTSASVAARTVYYFNYEVPAQDENFQGSRQFTMSGSTLLARDSNVDFALAELYKMPPADYRPYMAGWNRSTSPKGPYMCIQHPYGDVKKVSHTDADYLPVTYFSLTSYKTYWDVQTWSEGVTEVGSSGSPLFDANGYIIGELTGGRSFCDTPHYDYFCQFSAAWNYFADENMQIATFISPNDTEMMSMEGYDPYAALQVKRLSNIKVGEDIGSYTVNSTPLVGHTYNKYTKFAEKYELKEPTLVYGVYMLPFRGKYDISIPITLEIYSGVEVPETLLSSTLVHPTEASFYRSGTPFEDDIVNYKKQELYVPLEVPVTVNENLFVVLSLNYDNITTSNLFGMSCVVEENRDCTAYFYDNQWKPFTESPYGNLNVSIWLDPVVAKSKSTSIGEASESKSNFAIYPNPTQGEVFITPSFEGEYKLFDMTGKMVGSGVFDSQINIPIKGFYILELLPNTGEKETHKIICH